MATLKVVLRKKNREEYKTDRNGYSPVYIRYIYKERPAYFNTEVKIKPEAWDNKKCEVNTARLISKTKQNDEIRKLALKNDVKNNILVSKVRGELESIINDLKLKNIEPTSDLIKNQLKKESSTQEQKSGLFWTEFQKYEEYKKLHFRKNTQKAVSTLKTKLQGFEVKYNKLKAIESIDLRFYEKFYKYLQDEESLSINTVGYYIKTLKSFLNWYKKNGNSLKVDLTKFKKPIYNREIIYLTESELHNLYNFSYSKSAYRRVVDLFVLQASLGLRISDFHRVNKSNYNDGVIEISSSVKTDKTMYIPLNSLALEILNKYNFNLPFVADQTLNKNIKLAAKEAEINDIVELTEFVKGQKHFQKVEKWSVLTSHTAVKTFITHCVEKGIPPRIVAEITGKSLKILMENYYGTDRKTIKETFKNAFR